jgi:hypothetical protein
MTMKTMFKKRWYFFVPLILAALVGFGFVTMYLWNWLMPVIFHLPEITFWQTVGLLVLSRIFFGGFGGHKHGHGHGHHHHCNKNLHEKWENMTPEEREKFQQHIHMHRPPWAHRFSGDEQVK